MPLGLLLTPLLVELAAALAAWVHTKNKNHGMSVHASNVVSQEHGVATFDPHTLVITKACYDALPLQNQQTECSGLPSSPSVLNVSMTVPAAPF